MLKKNVPLTDTLSRSGDVVLAINNVPVSGLSFYQAAQLLRSCKNKVQLTIMNAMLVDSPFQVRYHYK